MTPPRLIARAASALLGLALTGSTLTFPAAAPAVAATPSYLRSYSSTKWVNVPGASVCLKVKVSGVAGFELKALNSYVGVYVSRRVVAPKVQVTSYNKCGSGRVKKKLYKLQVQQSTFSSTCEPNVGLSVGYPWGVSVAATLACGTVTTATRTTTYSGKPPFTQYNSDTVISIANEAYGPVRWVANYQTGKVTYYDLGVPIQVNLVAYKSRSTSDSAHVRFSTHVEP